MPRAAISHWLRRFRGPGNPVPRLPHEEPRTVEDESYIPERWHLGVDGWIEENRCLQQQAAHRIELALRSPAGLPMGYSLEEWVRHLRDEEQRYARRVAY
jgi:hypothetical protein